MDQEYTVFFESQKKPRTFRGSSFSDWRSQIAVQVLVAVHLPRAPHCTVLGVTLAQFHSPFVGAKVEVMLPLVLHLLVGAHTLGGGMLVHKVSPLVCALASAFRTACALSPGLL